MATPVTKTIVSEPRTIMDDGNDDFLAGLLAKAVLFFDSKGTALAAHAEIDRLREWSEGLLHKPLRVLPSPMREILEQTLATGQTVTHRDITIPASTGVLELFRICSKPARNPAGSITGATVVVYDISPIHELGRNLGQLGRLASIGTLSAGMAHEIKNAMVAVKTFVDILVSKNQDSELAVIVGREISRIDSILAQMLRVSGPARPAFRHVALHELLDHALTVAQHRTAGSHILVERKLEADPDVVMGDASQLEQAFMNLLFNAVEAMGNHGTLTVASELTRRENGTPVVRLMVSDTGAGILPEDRHRLFEPFFTTKTTGHGLGLVITKRIIQDHRGSISVQSEPGEGTTFTIEIPSAALQP